MQYKDVCGGKLRVYENGAVFRLIGGVECVPTITNTSGYASVRLPDKNYLVHRLVAEAFIPNPENKPQVNHKDGNRRNNSVSNLEWVTAQENVAHAVTLRMRSTKFNDRLAALMKTKGESNYALAKALEISNSTVANWLSGDTAPIRRHLKQLADHYEITVDELLREEE